MGMGLSSGFAVGGGADALEQLLTRRLMEAKLQEQIRAQQAEEALRGRELESRGADREEDRAFRREMFGAQMEDREADNARQDEALQRETVLGRIKATPIGSTVSAPEFAEAAALGIRAPFKAKPIVEGQPQEWESVGTADQQTAAAEAQRRLQEGQERDADRDAQRALTASLAGAGSAQGSVQTVLDAQGNPAIVIVKKDGTVVPARMPEGMQPNKPAKPVTGAERQTLAFYQRAEQAEKSISGGLEDRIAAQGTLGQLQGQFAPNLMQTEDQQLYRQAQRTFTEARLRKESGAAIPQQEYDNDARTYFAQPGDTPAVKAQKKVARQRVLEGLKNAAGRAYGEFHGTSTTPGNADDPLGLRQ